MRRFHLPSPRSGNALAAVLILLAACAAHAAPASPPGEKPAPTPFTRLADAGDAAEHPDADRVVVLATAVNRVKPSGVTTVDGYELTKVLTPAGCRELSVLNWHYDPQSSYVEVREVAVLRDGERLPVDVSQVHDLPAPQAAIYWNDRLKTLQLPRLQVGDGIEVVTYRKGFTYALLAEGGAGAAGAEAPDDSRYIPPMPGEYFDIVLFAQDAPVLEKRYDLVLPADKRLHAEVYNGALYSSVTYDDATTTYSWWGLDLPPLVHERAQPDGSDFAPKVVMATAESWEAKSRWFFDVNRDQFQVTPAIREKVDRILAEGGLTKASEEKRAKALLHWVAQNIRYSGQTMGEGEGFTLHSGEMIFEQRSGVCKDIAGMLITMMRAAGMDSYAAMTMAGSRIDAVPADQFNHCVTALRLDDGSFRMYDPTWVPYNNDIWSLLETEQHYLVGTPAGETLSRIRYSPPGESPLRVRHQATLADDGTLVGSVRLEGAGALDGRLRRLVVGTPRGELTARCARLMAPAGPRIEITRVGHHDPEDFSADMWLDLEYRLPRFAQPVAGGWEFTAPLLQVLLHDGSLFRAGASTWDDERRTDVFLYFTQLLDVSERIRLPEGFRLVPPAAADPVDETYAAFSGAALQDGRDLTLTSRCEVRRRQIPPDGYPGFKQAMDAARTWGETVFRVAKEDR